MQIRGGWAAVRYPHENNKAIGVLRNTGSRPLENHKVTKAGFLVRPSMQPPAKCHLQPGN